MKKFNYIKDHFQFWILQFILFFSVFAFTGYNAKAEIPISKSPQTELVLSKKINSKKVISLKKAIAHLAKTFVFSQQFKFLKVDLIGQQQLLIVIFKAVLQKFISFQTPISFFPKRIISSPTDSDFPIFSIL
ncbi:MAG: hypothetical protein AB8H03_18805 [Saprospiraceae bacterium]